MRAPARSDETRTWPRPRLTCALTAASLSLFLVTVQPALGATADNLLDVEAFKGHVLYVDFWASWCAPCRESFPWMNSMQAQLGEAGLIIVAVNVDREHSDAEQFLRSHPAQFRIVYDAEGLLPEKFGVRGMPTSFLIDRKGHMQSRHEGFRLADRDALAQQIRSLVLAH